MIAALYARVSTAEQAEEGFSIAAQIKQLTEYCNKNDIQIYKVYLDEGISGRKEDRPQFQAMLKDADRKLFGAILVHKYDRFARNVELSQKIKKKLHQNNIALISITEPLEDSPMGFFVGGLHDLMAEYYSRNLAKESKKGHVERASQGLHNGSVPFGYTIDRSSGNMVINEPQAQIVRYIFELYNHHGYGSTKIAKELNYRNIPAAVQQNWRYYTVNRILKNVKYIGKIFYDGQVYPGKHEPIISDDEFYLVQNNCTDRTWKRAYRGANFEKYLMLGVLFCGECNCVMTIHDNKTSKTKKRIFSQIYYKCNNASRNDGTERCTHRKHYSVVKLEEYILNYIKRVSKGLENDYEVKKSAVIDVLSSRKEKVQTELEQAKKAYLAQVFSLEEYSEIRNKLTKELEELEQTKPASNNNDKKTLRHNIKSDWNEFEKCETIPEKRSILKRFVDKILVSRDKISVIFYIRD
jgi:site-specific DNA recombinase